MSRPKLLMACANYWHSPFQVGSHHLARGFVKAGWDVAFVSDPISPFHLLEGLSPELRDRFHVYRKGGVTDLDGRLWSYVPATVLSPHNKPLLRAGWVQRHWPLLSWPNVVDVVKGKEFGTVDLLYFDTTSQNFWLDKVVRRRSVFRVADRNPGFRKFTPSMGRQERELARSVDAVVYSAATLRPHVEALQPKASFHLPNGVDFTHFSTRVLRGPAELEVIPRPVAIYVGSMESWFDFDLLNRAVAQLPEVSFVLIGPDHLARKRLRPATNLHLLGRRRYANLPAYLQYADVGLIPFDVAGHGELINSVNPLKLYEYLAAGLPVVATEWSELTKLESPAYLCRTHEQFIEAVGRAVSGRPDRERFRSYASRAEWGERVTELRRLLRL